VQKIGDNPDYTNIKTKFYFGTDNQPPLQMLTDASRPTKQEISLLYKIYGDAQECRKVFLAGASKTHPRIMVAMITMYAEFDKLWAEVTGRKLTWGTFNQRRKDISTRGTAAVAQAELEITAQLQNQHQFEMEQRHRAAAAMDQWMYQQQVLANQRLAISQASAPRMTTINCSYGGTTIGGITGGTMTCQ
jgi:hypothetical protein